MKIAGRNISNLRYADDITLTEESEEKLKRLLMKVKEESEKVGSKLSIQKAKMMASGPWDLGTCGRSGELRQDGLQADASDVSELLLV